MGGLWHNLAVTRPLVLALVCVAFVACKKDDTPPDNNQKCCDNGTTRTIRASCEVGEVGLPKARCIESPDAGSTTCGDGMFDMAVEACDGTAGMGNCATGEMCTSTCTCALLCGNDVIDGNEACERNAQCTAQPGTVCRKCACEVRDDAFTVRDAANDLATGIDTTLRYLDFRQLDVYMPANGDRRFDMEMAIGPVSNAVKVEHCIVAVDGAAETRLCHTVVGANASDVFLEAPGSAPVSVGMQVGGTVSTKTVRITVPASFTFPTSRGMSFYAVTELGDVVADRLPDTGTIPITDVIGKE